VTILNIKYFEKPLRGTYELILAVNKEILEDFLSLHNNSFYTMFSKKMIYISKLDDTKIGFALFIAGARKRIHLRSLGIIKLFRRKGLAKSFLSERLDYWKAQGIKTSSVHVNYTNKKALRIYLSVGFQTLKFQTLQLFLNKTL